MVITDEMLQGQYVTDWTRKAMYEGDYVGKEVKDIIEDYCSPQLACNLMFEVELPDEDKQLLRGCAMIDEKSSGIYKSCEITGSMMVAGSRKVKNSSYVIDSTRVFDSVSVFDSSHIIKSTNVHDMSSEIMDSSIIWHSYNVDKSTAIFYSKNVHYSHFIFGAGSSVDSELCSSILTREDAPNFDHCILSTKSGECLILNHKVNEFDWEDFRSQIEVLYKPYVGKLAEFIAEPNNHKKQWVSWDLFSIFDNMNMWRKLLSFLPFEPTKEDYMLLYNLTMNPEFLKI